MNSEFVQNSVSFYDYSFPIEEICNHYQNIDDLPTDGALRYIDKMLMEEVMDDDTNELLESSDFQAKERSFYEVLGHEYPHQEPADLVTYRFSNKRDHEAMSRELWNGVGDHSVTDAVTRANNKPLTDDEFDTWSCADPGGCEEFTAYITDLRNASNGHQTRRANTKVAPFDLTNLLISCAQAIASDDQLAAYEILKGIKQQSSMSGDANQRIAHYMAHGLEARLDGRTGSWLQKDFAYDRMSAKDYFTAYCTSFISSSFKKISFFASNKLIAVRSKKSARVHVIDFGILYGFQWPAFIKHLGERDGGPPRLRITGIDFPQQEGEAVERIRDTRSRLVQYAEMFGVPFEYNAVLKSWESITVEDLAIEEGEFVAVNCLYAAKNLTSDDMAVTYSPRSMVLDLIRKMNPNIFVHGVLNGGYGVPYFMTRFREVYFHYAALFDMAETIIPKDRPERELMESILGKQAMNVIACEGWERVERPETYNQWQRRHVRAGFKQVRFERKLLSSILNKVRNSYHKQFVVIEDKKWVMLSWKGRTICALSCWQPDAV